MISTCCNVASELPVCHMVWLKSHTKSAILGKLEQVPISLYHQDFNEFVVKWRNPKWDLPLIKRNRIWLINTFCGVLYFQQLFISTIICLDTGEYLEYCSIRTFTLQLSALHLPKHNVGPIVLENSLFTSWHYRSHFILIKCKNREHVFHFRSTSILKPLFQYDLKLHNGYTSIHIPWK